MQRIIQCFFVIVCLSYSSIIKAQYLNIKIGTDDDEPSIMMNPMMPEQIVAGTNKASIYTSQDTGRTWSEKLMPNPSNFSGDPCIIVDTQQVFYHFSLGGVYNTTNWLESLVCYRSYDHGFTWPDSTEIGSNGIKDQDKEWAVVDRRNNKIYMTWTEFDTYGSPNTLDSSRIMFSSSSDQAHTWSVPKQLNLVSGDCVDDDNTTEGAVPAVGPNGEIYVAWADINGIKFDRSFDEGNTWVQQDIAVANQPNGWNYDIPGIFRANGLPIVDCDKSNSAYKGRVYLNWSDQLNGANDTDIWLTYSDDSGTTWMPRIRVNNDIPGKHQFFSWMTIDQSTGFIYVVFYDRRNYLNNKTDVYLARSVDGGNTFSNELISSSGFTPNPNIFFGDYTNISAVNNIVRPIWCRLEANVKTVWTALIDYNAPAGITNEQLDRMIELYPNPTQGQVTLHCPDHVHDQALTVEIVDFTGRIMYQLSVPSDQPMFEFTLSSLAAGIYVYRISSGSRLVKQGKISKL